MSEKSFSRDWFNRKHEDSYTYYDSSKRLFDWDRGLDNFSSYFMANNPVSDAGKFLGSMFKVLGTSKNTKYIVSGKGLKSSIDDISSSRAKDFIQVPINMLRDEDGTYIEDKTKVDAFYGASIQNACMATMQTGSEYKRSLELRGYVDGDKDKRSDVTKYLASLLNTERIDKKLAEKFPGYLRFVQKYKDQAYKNAVQSEDLMTMLSEDKSSKLLDLITKMIRYPANISTSDLEEFAEPLQKMKELLQRNGGIPTTLSGCETIAGEIAKYLYEFDPPPPSDGKGDDDKNGDNGDENDEGDGKDGKGGGDKAPGSSSGSRPLDSAARELMKEIINAGMKTDTESSTDRKDIESFNEGTIEGDGFDEEGEVFSSTIIFEKASSDKDTYKKVCQRIDMSKAQTLARLFARKNKDYKFAMKSMRSGRLDTDKLAEAKQGVPSIYERMGEIKTDKICVGVLIDESGSMGGQKIQKAREAAIFINEVFRKLGNVELFIYGHSADIEESGTTNMIIYREPGKFTDIFSLGSCNARIENRDGDAILATATRMRKQTSNNGIMFVISDGAPCADRYYGTSAIEDTRAKVLKAEALGFQVIQIAIDSSVPSERMFKHYIKMTDIANLPIDMVKFLSKKIDHLMKEKVFV